MFDIYEQQTILRERSVEHYKQWIRFVQDNQLNACTKPLLELARNQFLERKDDISDLGLAFQRLTMEDVLFASPIVYQTPASSPEEACQRLQLVYHPIRPGFQIETTDLNGDTKIRGTLDTDINGKSGRVYRADPDTDTVLAIKWFRGQKKC